MECDLINLALILLFFSPVVFAAVVHLSSSIVISFNLVVLLFSLI